MEILLYLVVLLQAFCLSLLLTPFVKKAAPWFGFVDHPDATRRVHVTPTPLLGGAAIYFSFIFTILVNLLVVHLAAPHGDPEGDFSND